MFVSSFLSTRIVIISIKQCNSILPSQQRQHSIPVIHSYRFFHLYSMPPRTPPLFHPADDSTSHTSHTSHTTSQQLHPCLQEAHSLVISLLSPSQSRSEHSSRLCSLCFLPAPHRPGTHHFTSSCVANQIDTSSPFGRR